MATTYYDKARRRWLVRYYRAADGKRTGRAFRNESDARRFASNIADERPDRRRTGMGRRSTPVADRIRTNSSVDPETGCWMWSGPPSNRGYAHITIGNRPKLAHRASYEAFVGPIPDGLVIDHLCRTPMCVNPGHLEPVTQRENVLRSPIAGGAHNASKTHCPQGHPYDEQNTYNPPSKPRNRYCRTCMRDNSREYARRKRARKPLSLTIAGGEGA